MNLTRSEFDAELYRIFALNGLNTLLCDGVCKKFFALTEIMLTENEKYNLTAITEPSKIILNHYADCVMLASKIKENARLIDVGCGAGFPTLPLAIIRKDINITAMDSTAKRINYVGNACSALGITNVTAIAARAEDEARKKEMRESFDYATARAVAQMRVLSELCLPFVKVGGCLLAMKGKNAEAEMQEAAHAITVLGGEVEEYGQIELKGGEEIFTHPIITVRKKSKTPQVYPRAFAQISKKPL